MSLLPADRWTPDEIADDPRGIWVVSIDFAGGTIRLADQETTIGDVQVYGGLGEIVWTDERALAIGEGADSEPQGVEVTAHLPPEFDVAQLVEDGHALDGAAVEVAIVLDGQAWEDRRVVLVGRVLDPSYGREGEPIVFSADATELDAAAVLPPAGHVASGDTWAEPADDANGLSYPIVLGRPGISSNARSGGSTAIMVDTVLRILLVSDGWVTADVVDLRDDSEEGTGWVEAEVSLGLDSDGQRVSTVPAPDVTYATGTMEVVGSGILWFAGNTISIGSATLTAVKGARTSGNDDFDVNNAATATDVATSIEDAINDPANSIDSTATATRSGQTLYLTATEAGAAGNQQISHTGIPSNLIYNGMAGATDRWMEGHTISVSWGAADAPLGGQPHEGAGGGTLTTAGEILEWLLVRSGRRVDIGRTRAAVPLLAGIQVGASIEESTDPLDWIRAHLLPILPVSMVSGPSGLYPQVLRWWAAPDESIGEIDLDRDGGSLVSSVELLGDVASEIDLAYARDLGRDEFTRRLLLSGDPDLGERGNTRGSNVYVRAAWARIRGRATLTLESDVLYDRGSAWRVATWLSIARWRRHPQLTVEVPRALAGWLTGGDLIRFTAADLRMVDKQAIIRSIGGLTAPAVSIGLTIIEHPRKAV